MTLLEALSIRGELPYDADEEVRTISSCCCARHNHSSYPHVKGIRPSACHGGCFTWLSTAMLRPTYGTAVQGFQVEEPMAGEQKAVLPAQCNQLRAIRTLRLDCFSDMKVFPPQVLPITDQAAR